jgi:hypothetical protein
MRRINKFTPHRPETSHSLFQFKGIGDANAVRSERILDGTLNCQIYTLCGRGHRSSLRVLKHGVTVTEMAVSDLPGRPTAVWTVKTVSNEIVRRMRS